MSELLDRRWKAGVLIAWIAVAAALIWVRWAQIEGLGLSDTDDNLRLAQVRALLDGQHWFDLAQHRLSPPEGANIHWSRIVDLPLAGLILLFEPFMATPWAGRWAAAIAPMIPLGLGLFAAALVTRRMIDPRAWPIGIAVALCAHIALSMWSPMRIDHHGWQLALLLTSLAGFADPRGRRGGATAGLASAVSLAIGLEMLIFIVAVAGLIALLWVRDEREAGRLQTYGASLAGGTAIGFLLFASWANRAPVCDALSPVWISALIPAGAALFALPMLRLATWPLRLGSAAVAGGAIGLVFVLLWPDCLTNPFGVSDAARTMWLDNVREAKPIYGHGWRTGLRAIALPLVGLIGAGVMAWRLRRDPEAMRWAMMALLSLVSTGLLFVQLRVAPGAQLIAVAGASALGWLLLARIRTLTSMPARIVGTLAVFGVITGYVTFIPTTLFPERPNAALRQSRAMAARCRREADLAAVGAQPQGLVLTQVDLGPRLIVTTHHDAIAGPYHRNGEAIVEIMRTFEGDEAAARAMIARRGVDYVLICPTLGETQLYRRAGSDSFAAHLIAGRAPEWLEEIALLEDSPLRLWRVRRD
ncbi:MAG: AcrB/AcrD/AcrF family protein [Sphingomonadaceae bacterium]|nr:AcrB/AcrD/AcrF family protein [Sphingomonadaceae bacterium]